MVNPISLNIVTLLLSSVLLIRSSKCFTINNHPINSLSPLLTPSTNSIKQQQLPNNHAPPHRQLFHHHPTTTTTTTTTRLFAKKPKNKTKSGRATRNTVKNRTSSASGFGGAATADCPCGSQLGYMKCCGLIHKSADAYAAATAEQVVRARYSAYAKREVDFIVGSTHPLNKNFMTDIEHWKKTIRENCYDNFELKECNIVSESYEGGEGDDKEIATVTFVAKMMQVDTRERTAFMETSTFERAGKHICQGAWLYRDGVIETPPGLEDDDDDKMEEEEREGGGGDKEG